MWFRFSDIYRQYTIFGENGQLNSLPKSHHMLHSKTYKRYADQILVLKDGEIVERGDHEELIKNDGLYSDLINAKSKAESWKLNN